MDAGLAGIGRARATADHSLPSFLKSDTLTSKPCTVRDRDPCAIQLFGQVKLVMQRWPQTPITSPEGAGCAHKQETLLLCHFTHLCYFLSKSPWSFPPLFSGSVIRNKCRCIIQYKIDSCRWAIDCYNYWCCLCSLTIAVPAAASPLWLGSCVMGTPQHWQWLLRTLHSPSLWLGPCCCVLRCLLSDLISSLMSPRSCHMECAALEPGAAPCAPGDQWQPWPPQGTGCSVCPAQGLGMWGEEITQNIPALSTMGENWW